MYSTPKKEHSIHFVNAFDKLQEQRRKLFEIEAIDNLLNFSDKKNICIVNRSFKTTNNNLLHYIITQFCIDYYFFSNKCNLNKKNKTILIDAGNGNNLGYIHQNLINQSIKTGFKINMTLDNIIVVRAFTFYQLANIIIKEIPRYIDNLDCNIQIIAIDLLDTLFKTNSKRNSKHNLRKNFYKNIKLLNEILDTLIKISDKHFVIVSYNDVKDLAERSIICKFKNVVEIDGQDDASKEIKGNKDKMKVQLKIKSINNTII